MRRRLSAMVPLVSGSVLGLLAVAGAGRDARADVSSFLALGGGATGQMAQGANTVDTASAFTYSIGIGTSPLQSIVGALMYRGATYFGLGTDIGTSLRVATGGFARGSWGAALDGGILYRTWGGGNYASSPLLGILTLGSPWGFQLALGTTFYDLGGATSAMGFTAALEMDILRFTVMRQGPSEHWWPNPNPAGGHEEKTVGLLSF